MSKYDELKLLSWNADGVKNKKGELLDLAVSDLSVDVIALSETRLPLDAPFDIPGYICYRKDKHDDGRGQGVAILIKSDLKHERVKLPYTHNMEAIGIVTNVTGTKIIILSIYQSPNLPLLTEDLDALLGLSDHVLIMGDFNANHELWHKTNKFKNTHGKILFEHMVENDYVIHASPTPSLVHYRPELQPTNPDLVLARNITNISNVNAIPALSSNHFPIYFKLDSPILRTQPKQYCYAKANWKSYRAYLEENIVLTSQVYNTTKEIDIAISQLTECISAARDKSVPLTSINNKVLTLPKYIKNIIKNKNRLRRQEQRSIDINIKRTLRSEINYLQKLIQSHILSHNNNVWNSKLEKIDNPTSDLWRLAKQLRVRATVIPPLIKVDGTYTTNIEEQCETLANAFHDNMNLTRNWDSGNTEILVQNSMKIINTNSDTKMGKPTRPKEIWKYLKQLKRRKSPGPDHIHNALLKNLSQKAVVMLTKIFNACLKLSYFPTIWKMAKVIAIKKPNKDEVVPSSYRPISLLPTIGKLFESVIYSRLLAASSHLLIKEQFGFRRSHSTAQQLARVAEHIAHNLNLKKSTGMFLLDIEKAFDTVWHEGLLHKLVISDIPLPLVKLIQSYLDQREFRVHIGDTKSGCKKIPAGVPQGSILGPYLFLIYLNDIPKQPRTSLACFADDTASLTSSEDIDLIIDRLQLSLELLHSYFTKWKLKLNATKTEAIMFTRQRALPKNKLKINDHPIPWSQNVKYLGITFDKKLNWSKHIETIKLKGLKAMNALSPIFNRRSKLSNKIKLKLYSTLMRPCFTYAAPVWSSTCTTNYVKLQVIQNRAIKIAYNTPFKTNLKTLHKSIHYPTIKEFIFKLMKKFYVERNPHHQNSLVSSIGQSRSHNLPYFDRYGTYRLPHHYLLDNA